MSKLYKKDVFDQKFFKIVFSFLVNIVAIKLLIFSLFIHYIVFCERNKRFNYQFVLTRLANHIHVSFCLKIVFECLNLLGKFIFNYFKSRNCTNVFGWKFIKIIFSVLVNIFTINLLVFSLFIHYICLRMQYKRFNCQFVHIWFSNDSQVSFCLTVVCKCLTFI